MGGSPSIVLAIGAVIVVLAYVAVQDLRFARIRNEAVLALIALWAVLAALEGFGSVLDSLAAGALLLALGFAAWTMKVVGAGDAKLLFAGGLLLGLSALLPFSIFMIAATILSVVALMVLRMAPFMLPPALAARLDVIVSTRRIPAAVPISIALALALPLRYGLV
ncbi:MAG TPA: prepilin peptidase [Methylomirabilota bacterium]|nr:prepilin peptidase [Methylomirabilota bacterium]